MWTSGTGFTFTSGYETLLYKVICDFITCIGGGVYESVSETVEVEFEFITRA